MDMTTTPPPLILNPMQHVREAGNTFCTSYDLSVQVFFFFYFGAHMQLTQKREAPIVYLHTAAYIHHGKSLMLSNTRWGILYSH